MKATLEELDEATARVERVIFLAGAMAQPDAFSDDLSEFFDDESDETITRCLGEMPEWVDLSARPSDRDESVWEWLSNAGRFGFLVKFSTPVMTTIDVTTRTFSWSHYCINWVYADTVEEAINKGLAWVAACRVREDAQVGIVRGGAA